MLRGKHFDIMDVTELYKQWLKGKSLRALGRQVGYSHSAVQTWFHKEYGASATDPVATSLLRSLLDDYPGNTEVEYFVFSLLGTSDHIEHKQHRSKHSINQLTKYQTAHWDTALDYLVEVAGTGEASGVTLLWHQEAPQEYQDSLRLPLFILFADTLVNLLCPLVSYVEPERSHERSKKGLSRSLKAA